MSLSPSHIKGWLAHYGELIGTWAKRNSRPSDAEDAAQDAMAQVLRDSDLAVAAPKAYLHRAAHNRLISEVRRQSRYPSVPLEALAAEDHPLLRDPEADIRARQLADALERALASLPLRKRQAYIWHRLEGYTQPEIAQRMGLGLNTIERYIIDATREMREQLQRFCPD